VSVEPCPDAADLALLEAKVAEAAVAVAGTGEEQDLAVFMRGPDGTVAAGISGVVVGGCLDLQAMWVDEALRGRGLARELFVTVEAEARRCGCSMVTLLAYDVTTGRLFERLGYRAAGVIETAFAGTPVRWYFKELTGSDALGPVADQNGRRESSQSGRPDAE
jgi:GNAT superfamily N-acetyltransferase